MLTKTLPIVPKRLGDRALTRPAAKTRGKATPTRLTDHGLRARYL